MNQHQTQCHDLKSLPAALSMDLYRKDILYIIIIIYLCDYILVRGSLTHYPYLILESSGGNYRSFCGIVPIGTVTIKYRFQNTRYIGTIGTFFLVTIAIVHVLKFVLFHYA